MGTMFHIMHLFFGSGANSTLLFTFLKLSPLKTYTTTSSPRSLSVFLERGTPVLFSIILTLQPRLLATPTSLFSSYGLLGQ